MRLRIVAIGIAGPVRASPRRNRGVYALHSTLAVENGVSAHVVAASLGHESSATTIQSYVKPEAVAGAQRRVMIVLEGGRLAS